MFLVVSLVSQLFSNVFKHVYYAHKNFHADWKQKFQFYQRRALALMVASNFLKSLRVFQLSVPVSFIFLSHSRFFALLFICVYFLFFYWSFLPPSASRIGVEDKSLQQTYNSSRNALEDIRGWVLRLKRLGRCKVARRLLFVMKFKLIFKRNEASRARIAPQN